MAYVATGTAGSDVLNQSSDTGPGTIVGLAGDDCIFTGSGLATVTGDSGNDTVLLKAGNTGTVNGGTENDSIGDGGAAVGAMQLFGGDGADTIWVPFATAAETIVGGNDSSDGNDSIGAGAATTSSFGNGGNDFLNDVSGNDTYVGGFGNDTVVDNGGTNLIFGNQGNDFVGATGVRTSTAGSATTSLSPAPRPAACCSATKGRTRSTSNGNGATVVGGNDSADGNDFVIGSELTRARVRQRRRRYAQRGGQRGHVRRRPGQRLHLSEVAAPSWSSATRATIRWASLPPATHHVRRPRQ